MSASPRDPERILRRLEWTVVRRLTGCCTATTGRCSAASAWISPICANTSTTTTSDTSTGTSPRVFRRPMCGVFNEDREITAWFLLDMSPSMDFGSREIKKRSISTEFVTVLARLLTRHGNRVGALFYGDSLDTVIPARAGRRHVLHLLHRMLSRPERPSRRPRICASSCRLPFGSSRGGRWCSSSRISSARPAGRSRSPTSRSGTRSWRCGSTTRWRCGPARPRAVGRPGRRDGRAGVCRHPRPRVQKTLRRGCRAAREGSSARRSAARAWTRSSCPRTMTSPTRS